jgi:hypothetical protein
MPTGFCSQSQSTINNYNRIEIMLVKIVSLKWSHGSPENLTTYGEQDQELYDRSDVELYLDEKIEEEFVPTIEDANCHISADAEFYKQVSEDGFETYFALVPAE